MLPAPLRLLTRTVGLGALVALAISPWLMAFEVQDPFLNQNWLILGLATIAACVLSVLRVFFRPRSGQLPYLSAGLLCWTILAVSTLVSPFIDSLRISLLLGAQLLLFLFLRLSTRPSDAGPATWLLVVSGGAMGVLALLQAHGWHVPLSPDSPYSVTGTLTNPNFLGAYLMTTLVLTLGLFLDRSGPGPFGRGLLGVLALVQIGGMVRAGSATVWPCLVLGLLLMRFHTWETRPGRWGRLSPLLGGLFLALVCLATFGLASFAVGRYPWSGLGNAPFGYFSVVTRLLIWRMGFLAFLENPWSGLGPGGLPYVLSQFRPANGTLLGLSPFNDDPHSLVLQLLGETGLFGLIGFCSLVATGLGLHAWRVARTPMREHAEATAAATPEGVTSPADVSGGTPALGPDPALPLGRIRTLAAAALALLVHFLFNPGLGIFPLSSLLLILVAIHQTACLREIRWRRGFSFLGLGYLLLPVAFGLGAFILQSNYQHVSRNLFLGQRMLEARRFTDAEAAFQQAVNQQPQSMQGLLGLALALEGQGRLATTQDLLGRLDHLSPNVFGTRFHLARILLERNLILEAHRFALLSLAWNQNPATYELLGRILVAEGRLEEAQQVFREGLLLVPTWRPEEQQAADRIRIHLATLEIDQGNLASGERLLTEVQPPAADGDGVLYLRGLIRYRGQDASGALALFEQALARNASEPKYWNAVGYLLAETGGDLDRAETLLQGAYQSFKVRTPPLMSDVLQVAHSLGMLYWRKGNLDRAEELLSLAFQQCPLEWKEVREGRGRDLNRFLVETRRGETASGTGP